MTPRKTLLIHLGYHKTGSSSIQKWLLDHAPVLEPHLHCYNLADGSSNPLKFAVHDWLMKGGSAAAVAAHCQAMAAEILALPQQVVCITDESLLGMPLGFVQGDYVETGIYPRAGEVVEVLAREFAAFDTVFVVFERDPEAWLRSVHNQMFKQGCVTGSFEDYVARFDPVVDWPALRAEITAGIGGNGRLEVLEFETEFDRPMVADMSFFQLLNIPAGLLDKCRPRLEQINPSVPIAQAPARPKRLPVTVLGGSNSMIANGWVHLMRRDYAAMVQVTNLSIGACTSAMGLYRLLSQADRPPGTPVIWEYGVNEYNHLVGGQPLASLVRHVEWLLQICIRENRPFVPVLMRNQHQAVSGREDAYVRAITDLFRRYDLAPVDCNMLLRVMMRGGTDFAAWYADGAHYSTATEFPRRVAEAALLALDQARVPRQDPARAAYFDALDLVVQYPQDATEVFDNTMVSCRLARFEDAPVIEVPGRALAAIIVTSGSGPDIRIEAEGVTLGLYATQVIHGPKVPERQLRQLVLGSGLRELEVPGGQLRISVAAEGAIPMVQCMYTRKPPAPSAHPNGVVAILCEKPR